MSEVPRRDAIELMLAAGAAGVAGCSEPPLTREGGVEARKSAPASHAVLGVEPIAHRGSKEWPA